MTKALNPAKQFIDNEFPESIRPLVAPALRRAYTTVDSLMERVEFLSTPSGRYQRGDLIVKATEFEFYRLIMAGSLPFDPAWEDYAAPTGKHLVMRSGRARITINQVESIDTKPRKAVFRENYGISNMAYLWPEWNEAANFDGKRRHLLVLHGYQVLTFAGIGLPHPKRNRLLWYTENLMNMPHAVPDEFGQTKVEGPSESPDPEAIEELLRFINDNE